SKNCTYFHISRSFFLKLNIFNFNVGGCELGIRYPSGDSDWGVGLSAAEGCRRKDMYFFLIPKRFSKDLLISFAPSASLAVPEQVHNVNLTVFQMNGVSAMSVQLMVVGIDHTDHRTDIVGWGFLFQRASTNRTAILLMENFFVEHNAVTGVA
ncbi:hypothetical protein SNEBB_004737, partial [Seison nebaliae]